MLNNIKVGATEMRVSRRDETGKVSVIHKGVVIQDLGNFVRLYNSASTDKGGDTAPENAEVFPLSSRRIWCEVEKQRKDYDLVKVPALYTF